MKKIIYIMFALALVGCKQSRQQNNTMRLLSSIDADSILASQFVMAIRDAGFWAQYDMSANHLVIGTDTAGMTKSVDSLARDFFMLAGEQRVKVKRCSVIDYNTKDTLAVYE